MTDQAGVHELLECTGGLGVGDLGVGPVHLVEVDVLDPQRLEARLDAAAKPTWARVAHQTLVAHPQAALGGDDDLSPAVLEIVPEGLSQQPLGGAPAVALSGVEQVHAELAGIADRLDSPLLVEGSPVAAQLPGTEGDRRHLEIGHPQPDPCQRLTGHRTRSSF